jgi:tetratricopeptide (TPR) repeat protein
VSRTKALLEAQKTGADYILLLDADMVLKHDASFDKSKLTLPVYSLYQETEGGLKYTNVRMVRSEAPNCKYVGVTHEYFDSAGHEVGEIREGVSILDRGDGGSKSDKFERDIRLLEGALKEKPNNDRYEFYLANSYFDTQHFKEAIAHYTIRIDLGGWAEEVYYSMFRMSLAYKGLNMEDDFVSTALRAYKYRPSRAESVYEVMNYFHNKKDHKMVVAMSELVKDLKTPNDKLFVATHIYEYQLHYIYSLSAFFVGAKSCAHYAKLFNTPHLSLTSQFNNYRFYYPVPVGTCVDFTTTHLIAGEEFYTSSPSIVSLNGKYLMNVRLVNYRINKDGGYDMKGKSITTKNKMLLLNKALEIVDVVRFPSTVIAARSLPGSSYKYEGIEDIKLGIVEGKIQYTATMCLANQQIGTCYGVYDEVKLQPTELKPFQGCEKNWVFLPNQMSMVYDWCPLRFGPVTNETLELTETRAMPKLFQFARGSCNGVEFEGEYWFVVHYVYQHPNELRFYTHSLVVFDINMKLRRYTLPFKFTKDSSIEYCLGLVVEKERLLLSHSVMDRESYVRVYNRAAFDWVQA